MSEANQAAKPVLTKEEKLAKIQEQIAKLQQRYDDVLNDRVVARAKKETPVPNVGDKVLATIGRNTATTQAKVEVGTVVAIKFPEEGSKGGVQVRVRLYEGQFEEQLVTLYAAQVEAVRDEAEAAS